MLDSVRGGETAARRKTGSAVCDVLLCHRVAGELPANFWPTNLSRRCYEYRKRTVFKKQHSELCVKSVKFVLFSNSF